MAQLRAQLNAALRAGRSVAVVMKGGRLLTVYPGGRLERRGHAPVWTCPACGQECFLADDACCRCGAPRPRHNEEP